jgi:hypothetical protein
MADQGVGKPEGNMNAAHHNDINDARRSSVASVNLNKNLDAKYVCVCKHKWSN